MRYVLRTRAAFSRRHPSPLYYLESFQFPASSLHLLCYFGHMAHVPRSYPGVEDMSMEAPFEKDSSAAGSDDAPMYTLSDLDSPSSPSQSQPQQAQPDLHPRTQFSDHGALFIHSQPRIWQATGNIHQPKPMNIGYVFLHFEETWSGIILLTLFCHRQRFPLSSTAYGYTQPRQGQAGSIPELFIEDVSNDLGPSYDPITNDESSTASPASSSFPPSPMLWKAGSLPLSTDLRGFTEGVACESASVGSSYLSMSPGQSPSDMVFSTSPRSDDGILLSFGDFPAPASTSVGTNGLHSYLGQTESTPSFYNAPSSANSPVQPRSFLEFGSPSVMYASSPLLQRPQEACHTSEDSSCLWQFPDISSGSSAQSSEQNYAPMHVPAFGMSMHYASQNNSWTTHTSNRIEGETVESSLNSLSSSQLYPCQTDMAERIGEIQQTMLDSQHLSVPPSGQWPVHRPRSLPPPRHNYPTSPRRPRSQSYAMPRPSKSRATSPNTQNKQQNTAIRGPPRGRRKGPMSDDGRSSMSEVRRNKSMCIGCKYSKVKCERDDGSDICVKCRNIPIGSKLPYVCTKAYFMPLIQIGPTNYLAQHYVNHLQRDLIRRTRLEMPDTINMFELMRLAASYSNDYDVRVSQGNQVLYDIDLAQCHAYLAHVGSSLPSLYSFQSFIGQLLRPGDDWKACIKDSPITADNLLAKLTLWNNAPSRLTFSLVSKCGGDARPLDPDRKVERPLILGIAQIARIMGRRLEVTGYLDLQKKLLTPDSATAEFIQQLGAHLLSLRWRLSWWALFELGVNNGESDNTSQGEIKEVFERVRKLCRTLYFYFVSLKRRATAASVDTKHITGQTSQYPDAQHEIYEAYPWEESESGWLKWENEGKDKIEEAGVKEQLHVVFGKVSLS
ncbi:hypothetical protein B0I35DRAFT_163639 [Stachybotrys elegans]|uniref:Zn(2)-C6 fungal-type domain-containing protein n=1 Tax=Stachybotrys elegans TaxID=80388 RepID=A0A8K0SVM0_9HYPO|nr:hypothetical protein B0I35DRAFT_163639 [Stachybotrys elegans]